MQARSSIVVLAVALCAATATAGPAAAQSGGAYSLSWSTLDGGGMTVGSTGGAYSVRGSAGQPAPATAVGGAYAVQGGFWNQGSTATGVDLPPDMTQQSGPLVFRLHDSSPNPFVATTTVAFSLAQPAPTRVLVYDVAGRRVRTLFDGPLQAGRHQVAWDGQDDQGHRVAEGVYILRLDSARLVATRKLVVLR